MGGGRGLSWGALAQPVSNARRHRLVSPVTVVLENTVEFLLALGLGALQRAQLLVSGEDGSLGQLVRCTGRIPLSSRRS